MIFLGGVLLRTGYSLFSGLAWLNSFVFTGRIYCRALNGAESSHTHTHSGQEVSTRAKVLRLLHTNLRGGGVRGLIDCFKVGKWGGGGGGGRVFKAKLSVQ